MHLKTGNNALLRLVHTSSFHTAFPGHDIITVCFTDLLKSAAKQKQKLSPKLTPTSSIRKVKLLPKLIHIISRNVHLITVKREVIPTHAMTTYTGHEGRAPLLTLALDAGVTAPHPG
jgi:hypothetical protein